MRTNFLFTLRKLFGSLYREAMYTQLDLEDSKTVEVIANTLHKVAIDLALDLAREGEE